MPISGAGSPRRHYLMAANAELRRLETWWAASLHADRDPIFDLGNARCGPRRALRFLAFSPCPDRAPEDDLAAIDFDSNPARVDFGAAAKGFLDLLPDF